MHYLLVIGAGTMGRMHSRAYRAMKNVRLAGIIDIRRDAAEKLAQELDSQAFASLEEAMEKLDHVDVIDVCVPTPFHKEYVIQAAKLGKDTICEKPLARNLEDAREIIDTCRDHKVRLFVAHVIRFFPEYGKAKMILDQGQIGEVGVARTYRGGSFPRGWNDWYADFQMSGGLVLDAMIHDVDFLQWCFGDVKRVFAKGLHGRELARLDYALVTLRFQSGVIAHLEGTWSHSGFAMKFELAGTQGIIDYDSSKSNPLVAGYRQNADGKPGVAVPESPLKDNPYYLELEHFLHCRETGAEPAVTAEDAYRALEVSLAALQSIQSGRPVTLGQPNHPAGKGENVS